MATNQMLTPERISLASFVRKPGTQFVIPVYQREYVWRAEKETKKFLDDFSNVVNAGDNQGHFLGIVIYRNENINYYGTESQLIDGQQRITTVFLMLQAIKYIAAELGDKISVQRINNTFLTLDSYDDRKYRLKPQISSDDIYEKIADNQIEKITNKDSNVYKNYVYIKDYIKKLCTNHKLDEILEALDRLSIVCVPIQDNDNPQKIFESINATGSKLTAADLIRNFVLMDMDSDSQDKYFKDFWQEIEKYISCDTKKLENFFRVYVMTKNLCIVNKNAIYETFVQYFNDNIGRGDNGEKDISNREKIFNEILLCAEKFNLVYYADLSTVSLSKDIKLAIDRFRKNSNSDLPAPVFVELLTLYGDSIITSSQVSEIINITTNYLARRALCNQDTSAITRLFPPLLSNLLDECVGGYDNIVEKYKKLLIVKNKNTAMFMPDDVRVYDSIFSANMYAIKVAVRAFFETLEMEENSAPIDFTKLSVEHLMPQTPSKEWLDLLGVDKEVYERNVHRLGNLTFATKGDNSRMSNKGWGYKKVVLEGTDHLRINKELFKVEKWDVDCIEKRTKELIADICRLYPYPDITDMDAHYIEVQLAFRNGMLALGRFMIEDGSIEIQADSEMVADGDESRYPGIAKIRKRLLDDGKIQLTDRGYVFVEPCVLYARSSSESACALSTAASTILYNQRNGWDCWRDMNGNYLDTHEDIARRFGRKVRE